MRCWKDISVTINKFQNNNDNLLLTGDNYRDIARGTRNCKLDEMVQPVFVDFS